MKNGHTRFFLFFVCLFFFFFLFFAILYKGDKCVTCSLFTALQALFKKGSTLKGE